MRCILIAAVLIVAAGAIAFAQSGSPQRAETGPDLKASPLAKFIGRWEGESQITMPGMPEPLTAHVIETAQWKLGGTAVMVEGRGTIKDPQTGQEQVVHDALGIMRFDPRSKTLRFIAMKANEPMIDSELEVLEHDVLRWSMEPGPGQKVRFTITLTDDTWEEVGEFSPDGGATWLKFLQMNLKRVGAS